MSSEEDKSQKTEDPTPHKLEKAKKDGQFAISKELSQALMLGTFTICIFLLFPSILKKISLLLQSFLHNAIAYDGMIENLGKDCQKLIIDIGIAFAIPILAIIIMAFIAGLGQTQFKVTTKNLAPKMNRVSPKKGLEKILSVKAIIEFLKSLAKFSIISTVVFFTVSPRVLEVANYPMININEQLSIFSGILLRIMTSILICIFIIAIFDFFYEKWMYRRQLRMSKQEVKEENKNLEGDPQVKGRLRSIRMQRAKKRIAEQVPQATVLITNPTHYAVALQYEWGHDGAPVVLAKGLDYLALKMREIAAENNIPIIDSPPLARALYKETKEGKEIPVHHYEAVANIIRYVYDLKNKKSAYNKAIHGQE
jgi:flagellar biosynthetic protein FlhB